MDVEMLGEAFEQPETDHPAADAAERVVEPRRSDHERLATLPLASGMRYFRSELDDHILRSTCPAGVCRPIAVATSVTH